MNGSATATGLHELTAQIGRLDAVVTARLKQTAKASADRIAAHAAAILRSTTHGTGRTANSIRVLDESSDKQYLVQCPGDSEQPANLPMWLERGTRYMSARPFMRPAADAEEARYRREMIAAAEGAIVDVLS